MNPLRFLYKQYCRWKFRRLFLREVAKVHAKSLYVFDLDNTIGNTHPVLLQKHASLREKLLSIPAFPRMVRLVQLLQQSPSRHVMFMSARSYRETDTTIEWLNKIGLQADATNVIIVPSPMEKVKLLSEILPRVKRTWLIDDLSYNHERGEVKFYTREIDELQRMPLRYVGYSAIGRFVGKG